MFMTVGRRVVAGFAIPLLLLATVVAVAYVALVNVGHELTRLTAVQEGLMTSSRAARSGMRDAERAMLEYLISGDPVRVAARREFLAMTREGLEGMRRAPGLEGER